MDNLQDFEENKKQFFMYQFRRVTISEIRSIVRRDNIVSLWYNLKTDSSEPKLVFNIIKNSKKEFVLQIHIPLQRVQDLQLLSGWRYKNEFELNDGTTEVYIKKESLQEILNILNFLKHLKVMSKVINTDMIDFENLIGDSNEKDLPYDKLFVDNNCFGNDDPSKVKKWTEENLFKVLEHALNYLEIPYIKRNDIITWWYNGYKFKTKSDTVSQIGYGICYKLKTFAPKEFGSLSKTINSHGWIFAEFLDVILLANLMDKTKYIGYTNVNLNKDYNNGLFIDEFLVDDGIMHPGDPSYIADSVFDDCPNDKYNWIGKNKYWLSSEKIKPEIIEKEALKKLLEFDSNIIEKLRNLKFKNIIIGYYGYREIYCHPDPYKHSAFNCWRYNNPIVLNVETGLVEYYVMHNNDKFSYPDAKILNNKLLVQFKPNILYNWCYEIPLENGIN